MRVVRAEVEASVVWQKKIEQEDIYLLSKQASYKISKNCVKKLNPIYLAIALGMRLKSH